MAEQGVTFVRIKFDGSYTTALSPNGYAADPINVQWQGETRRNQVLRLAFARKLIKAKLKASIETLRSHMPDVSSTDNAITRAEIAIENLPNAETMSILLSVEGKAANAYWRAWKDAHIQWVRENRYPIPEEWRAFKARASVLTGVKHKNLRASNQINAMLNYAYAVLMTRMKIEAITHGFDPLLGVMHDQREKSKQYTPSFALDIMEPLRPVADRAVLKLIEEERFCVADFELQSDGVCRLNPELARHVAQRTDAELSAVPGSMIETVSRG